MFKIYCNAKVVGTAATHDEALKLTRKRMEELDGSVYFMEVNEPAKPQQRHNEKVMQLLKTTDDEFMKLLGISL